MSYYNRKRKSYWFSGCSQFKEGVVEARTIWKRIWSLSTWLDPNCCTGVRCLWDFSPDDETTDKKLDEKERLLLYNCPSSPKGYVSPLSYTICMQIYIILDSDGSSLQIPSSSPSLRLDPPYSWVKPAKPELEQQPFQVLSSNRAQAEPEARPITNSRV